MSKSIVYSEIPVFDQSSQYIRQMSPIDMGDYLYIGIEVRNANTGEIEFTVTPNMSLDDVKSMLCTAVSMRAKQSIYGGFTSDCTGVEKTYRSDAESQLSINGLVSVALAVAAGAMTEQLLWKAAGEPSCYEHSPSQIFALGQALKRHVEALKHECDMAQIAIMAAETILAAQEAAGYEEQNN